jgi:SOS response regulatory protein OraA/RecX
MPSADQNDGTPTSDPEAALHWAAMAVGLAERRTRESRPLTADEHANYDRYLAAARSHGFTDEDISDYLVTTLYPSLGTTT